METLTGLEQPCLSTCGFSFCAAQLVAPALCRAVTRITGELSDSLLQGLDGRVVENN